MLFQYKGKAEPKKIDVKRGSGDESKPIVVIKFEVDGNFSSASAAAALGCDTDDVRTMLFRPHEEDVDENSPFLGLKWMSCDNSWDARHELSIGEFKKLRCDYVGAIQLRPRSGGMFNARFSVTLGDTPDNFIESLAEKLNGEVQINLEHDAELPLSGGEAKARRKKKGPAQTDLSIN